MLRFARITTVVIIVLAVVTLLAFKLREHNTLSAEHAQDVRTATALSASTTPMVGKDEYLKWNGIVKGIRPNSPISDADFNWLMGLLGDGHAANDAPWYVKTLASTALASLNTKYVTDAQQKRIYDVELPLLSYNDTKTVWGTFKGYDYNYGVRIWACSVMKHYHFKQAIPQIAPLLNDPHPETRRMAADALKSLGYQIDTNK